VPGGDGADDIRTLHTVTGSPEPGLRGPARIIDLDSPAVPFEFLGEFFPQQTHVAYLADSLDDPFAFVQLLIAIVIGGGKTVLLVEYG